MSKLQTIFLAAGLAFGGAQAQGQSEVACGENQTKIASALAGGKVIGCKDIEGANNTSTVEAMTTSVQKSSSGLDGSILIAPVRNGSDNGIGVGVTLGEEGFRLRLAGEVSEDQRAALIALGYAVDNIGHVILTASQRTALLEHFGKDITATGISIEGSLSQPLPGVHSVHGRLMHEKGHSKHLATDVDVSSVTVDDILLSSALMPDGGRKTTRTVISTTTETTTTTDTRYAGGSRNTLIVGAKVQIAPQTLGSISVAHTNSSLTGKETSTAVSAIHYIPEQKANISFGGNNRGNVALGMQKQVADGVNFIANLTGKSKDTLSGYVGVNIEFGGKPVNPGTIPTTQQSELRNVMNSMMPSKDGVGNPNSLGTIVRDVKTTQTVRVVTNSSSTIQNPEVKNPEKPIIPPGAPVCSADDTSNTINCSDDPATLEMSVNGGAWIAFVATGHTGSRTVEVRKNINGVVSPSTRVTFTETVWAPPTLPATLPAINVGDGAGGSVVFSVVMPSNLVDQNNNPIQFNLDGLPNIDAAGTPVSWTISQNGTTINVSSTQFQGMPPATTIQTYPLVVTPVGNSANGSTSISLRIETN